MFGWLTLISKPPARNNLRAMTKGDLAFFYHSNCKVPGIVGVAEIVGEGVVDGEYMKLYTYVFFSILD